MIRSRSPKARRRFRKLPCSTAKKGPLRTNVPHNSAAVAPPCCAIIERHCCTKVDKCSPFALGGSNHPLISSRIIAMLCTNPWRKRSDIGEPSVSRRSLQYPRRMAASPGRRPERPRRWRKLATEGGGPICTTVLMLPMSMPSSSVVVQIAVAGRSPALRVRSVSSLISFDRLP